MKRYKVRILPSAYSDISSARDWYRQYNLDLPLKFTQQLKFSVEQIRTTPYSHTLRYKNVRIANLKVFPYAVHYFIENDTIIIIAVHHAAISPDKWKNRVK